MNKQLALFSEIPIIFEDDYFSSIIEFNYENIKLLNRTGGTYQTWFGISSLNYRKYNKTNAKVEIGEENIRVKENKTHNYTVFKIHNYTVFYITNDWGKTTLVCIPTYMRSEIEQAKKIAIENELLVH